MTKKENGGSAITTPAEPQANLNDARSIALDDPHATRATLERDAQAEKSTLQMDDIRISFLDPTKDKRIDVLGMELFKDPILVPEQPPQPKLVEPKTEIIREFRRISAKYFLLNLGGRVCVGSLEYEPENEGKRLYHYSKTEFRDWEQTRVLDEDGTKVHVATRWLDSGGKRQYKGVGLYSPSNVHSGYLNLWEGLAIEPNEGSFQKIEHFIRSIFCTDVGSNDPSPMDRYYRNNTYVGLINLLAYWVQNPTKPGLCALLLTGSKGSGKGTFCTDHQSDLRQESLATVERYQRVDRKTYSAPR